MNNDLISRSALMAEYCGACDLIEACWCDGDICPTGQMIKEIPAVDAVEVVRCKDCKHYAVGASYVCEFHSEFPDQYSRGLDMQMLPDDFCSYGERRTDG